MSGTVELLLRPYTFSLIGVETPCDLMKTGMGDYGEVSTGWNADDVKGFTKLTANPMKIYRNMLKRNGEV